MRNLLLVAILAVSGWSAGLTSEVKEHNGAPALYVNGKLTSQVLAAPYRAGTSDYTDFLKAGQNIFDIYLRFPWTAPETYDFSRVDQIMDGYLKIEPKALFLPRILLSPGNWWCKEFPNDFTMRDDGSPAGMFGGPNPCYPSLSSEKYRSLSHKAVIAFIQHVEGKYGDNIVGYQVGNGFGGEWLMFNSFWEVRPGAPPPTKFGVEDYSPAAIAGFRNWLRQKYTTVEHLRVAWGDPKVTFEAAPPPNEKDRCTPSHGIFFDPGVSSRVTDFFSYFNDSVSDTLIENATWVKELTGRRKIVGAFYGYLWCNFPNLSVNHTGHLGLAKVLRSPDVDFIASPYTYDNKQIGGPNNSQTLPEAVALHGKLYFNEVDTETHLQARQWRWGNSLNNPRNWQETAGLLTRDYAYALTKNLGMWWTDLHGGNFHDDQILGLLKDLKSLDDKSLNLDRTPSSEIAVVLDEETFKYFGDGEPIFNATLTAQKQWELAFMGAPWDAQLLTDMGNPKLRDYKMYVFLNTWRVTPEQRDAIHARLRRNGATAVWVYAPGYIGDKLSVENMQALTGIKLAENNTAGELHIDVTSLDHAYTKGLAKAFAYGTDVNVANIVRWYDHQIYLKDPRDPGLQRDLPGFRVSPRFYSEDPQARVLGKLAGVNKPGLVVKKQQGWTSVYSAAPILPAELLRNIARAAGVHIYSDVRDVVTADRNYVAIYAPAGGVRTVHLRAKSHVTDALTGKIIADAAKDFPLQMEANATSILRVEPEKLFASYFAAKDVEPSADPNSPFWKGITGVTIDRSVLGPEMPQFRAEVRSRWTENHLYFLFSGAYEKLTLKANPDLEKETYRLWEKDCFEVYLGADFEHTNRYREFQMSPAGEFLDLDIDSTKTRPGFNGENLWNAGMKVKARFDEAKKIWHGEMRIPIVAVDTRPAREGNEMRINLFRQDGVNPNRDFLAWQPPMIWNPHHPESFGTLRLVKH